jgi:hypothetical protein
VAHTVANSTFVVDSLGGLVRFAKRPIMKPRIHTLPLTVTYFAISMLWLALEDNQAWSAIPLREIQVFDTSPAPSEWSTKSIRGDGGSIVSVLALEASVQTNAVFSGALATTSTVVKGGSPLARWHSSGRYLVTRPADNAYTLLLATIRNSSDEDVPSPVVVYDLSLPSPEAGEDPELSGHRVYYSLTGAPNSWILISGLTGSSPGRKVATLSLGSWPPGTLFYLLWVDDNGSPGKDGPYAIDNFHVEPDTSKVKR